MTSITINPAWIWALGFTAFCIPAAVPSANKYRYQTSQWILFCFVGIICLYYFVLFYYKQHVKAKEEKAAADARESDLENLTSPLFEEPQPVDQAINNLPANEATAIPQQKKVKKRSYFLDNVKIFLTVLILLYHLTAGFGAMGGVMLAIAKNDNTFSRILSFLVPLPTQAYAMPLFFFISAYFTPKSFAKKGRAVFIKERAQQIWIGAMIASFTLIPLASYWANMVAGNGGGGHMPVVSGTVWFLYWLLLFNLWYAFTVGGRDGNAPGAEYRLPFSAYFKILPNMYYSWITGLFICGLLQLTATWFLFASWPGMPSSNFAAMPIAYGNFFCDLLFFYVGLLAGENGWFEQENKPLRSCLGMNVWVFRVLVVLEYAALIGMTIAWDLFSNTKPPPTNNWIWVLWHAVAGLFFVDFSVAILEFFQSYLDFRNGLSMWLANGAYGAYLVQNILIYTCPVAIFVYQYQGDPEITFNEMRVSSTPIPLVSLSIGFIYAALVWVPACWIVTSFLRKMPLLKHVL